MGQFHKPQSLVADNGERLYEIRVRHYGDTKWRKQYGHIRKSQLPQALQTEKSNQPSHSEVRAFPMYDNKLRRSIGETVNMSKYDPENEVSKKAKQIKYGNAYELKNFGGDARVRLDKVVVRDTKTGKIYGSRAIPQRVIEMKRQYSFLDAAIDKIDQEQAVLETIHTDDDKKVRSLKVRRSLLRELIRKLTNNQNTSDEIEVHRQHLRRVEDVLLKLDPTSVSEALEAGQIPFESIDKIRKLIRQGARDPTHNWANAIELVHVAYETESVQRPTPSMKKGWDQYEEMLLYAVQQLQKATDKDLRDDSWIMVASKLENEASGQGNPLNQRYRSF